MADVEGEREIDKSGMVSFVSASAEGVKPVVFASNMHAKSAITAEGLYVVRNDLNIMSLFC